MSGGDDPEGAPDTDQATSGQGDGDGEAPPGERDVTTDPADDHLDSEAPSDTTESRRFERIGGWTVLFSIVLMGVLVAIGHPLFWVPFAVGIGLVLPALAILADRERSG